MGNTVSLPSALEHMSEIREAMGDRTPVFFLDLDGTLAPIVPHPDMVRLSFAAREVLQALADTYVVCIASGRELADLRQRVELPALYYAADHGHHVLGPEGSGIELQVGPEDRLELEAAVCELEDRLHSVPGVVIEAKENSLSVHYRLVAEEDRPLVDQVVKEVAEAARGLVLKEGKLVHELRPKLPWNKGRAVLWLLGQLRLRRDNACPVCIGDDLTDEDMFRAVRGWGISVIVGEVSRPTMAKYALADPEEVVGFLQSFTSKAGEKTTSKLWEKA